MLASAASDRSSGGGVIPIGIPGLSGLSCGSESHCVGIAGSGAVVYTSNGGRTWLIGFLPRGPLPTLNSVSCGSATHCVAITGAEALVTNNGGATWSQTSAPQGFLASVSCPTVSHCVAVGNTGKGGPDGATAAYSVDGGRSWITVQVPYVVAALEGLACASKNDCVALGGAYGADLPVTGFYTTNGGISWSAGRTPTAPAGSAIFIDRVSCSSTTMCAAVGSQGFPAIGAESVLKEIDVGMYTHDGGRSWFKSTFEGPMSNPSPQPTLVDVYCSSHLSCVAVGGNGPLDGIAAFSKNGGQSWSAAFVTSHISGLYAVACTTPNDCIGVGGNDVGYNATAVYTRDAGKSWS